MARTSTTSDDSLNLKDHELADDLIKAPAPVVDKSSLSTIVLVMLLSSTSFAIVVPSLFPYVERKGGDETFLGFVTAGFAVGQIIAGPIFGIWSDRRSAREVFSYSLTVSMLGNIYYGLAPGKWHLLASRIIIGSAAANGVVAQNYITRVTTAAERTKTITYTSIAQAAGFILGPAIAAIFPVVEFDYHSFHFNAETAPGFVSAFFAAINLLMVHTIFKEIPRTKKMKDGDYTALAGEDTESGPLASTVAPEEDEEVAVDSSLPVTCKLVVAVVVCLILNFASLTVFTVFETLLTPFMKDEFNFGVAENSYVFVFSAFVSVLSFSCLLVLSKRVSDRLLVLGGFIGMTLGFVPLISYGCKVTLYRFMGGLVCISLGYPIAVSVIVSLYTKILGNRKQGGMLGWLQSAGSLSRIIGPLVGGRGYQVYGADVIWGGMDAMLVVSVILILVTFVALKPSSPVDVVAASAEDLGFESDSKRSQASSYAPPMAYAASPMRSPVRHSSNPPSAEPSEPFSL